MNKRSPATGRIEFTCDVPNCAAVIETYCLNFEAASRVARRRGWAIGTDSDACPRHHV
jgi:hypothetical protein